MKRDQSSRISVNECPICKSSDHYELLRCTEAQNQIHGEFSVLMCNKCDLGFVSPRPSRQELRKLYDESFYSRPILSHTLARNMTNLIFRPRRKRIEKIMEPGKILDYGCGDGRFGKYMADHGWDVTGFDFSPTAQKLAEQNRNLTIVTSQKQFDKLPSNSFDCITMWQVLEHIPEPTLLLRELDRLLKPSGILVISVPNIKSFQAKILRDTWWGLDVPRHLSHFSPQSLEELLKIKKFQIFKIRHLSLQYSPYSFFHSALDKLFTHRHFASDLVKRTIPRNMSTGQKVYNIATLVLLTPILVPVSLLGSIIASILSSGGFIEIYAKKGTN